ncbi:MAG: SDR family NAD(P)-dependent oxidoreductase [Pseudonocardia sp.]
MVTGRDKQRGQQVVESIQQAGGRDDFIQAELTASSARELARQALGHGGGRVDVPINAAGVSPFGPTDQVSEVDVDTVLTSDDEGRGCVRRSRRRPPPGD